MGGRRTEDYSTIQKKLSLPHQLPIIATPQDIVACNANSNYGIMFPRYVLGDGLFSPDPFCLRERLPVPPCLGGTGNNSLRKWCFKVVSTTIAHIPTCTASNSLDSISMTCNSALGKWTGLMPACAYHKHTIKFVMQSAGQLIES